MNDLFLKKISGQIFPFESIQSFQLKIKKNNAISSRSQQKYLKQPLTLALFSVFHILVCLFKNKQCKIKFVIKFRIYLILVCYDGRISLDNFQWSDVRGCKSICINQSSCYSSQYWTDPKYLQKQFYVRVSLGLKLNRI